MATQNIDIMALEQAAKVGFGMSIDIETVIVHDVNVSRMAKASVFLTKKKQLLCYIHAQSRLSLGDIQKIISRMGLRAELYMPPKGQPHYFDEIGLEKFREVFPGHKNPTAADIGFYRTLASYNPALVLVSEVKEGIINQYDGDASTSWRPAAKFAYRRIKTS